MAQEEFLEPPLPDIIAQWRFYFELLQPAAGEVILDVGSNTGDVERFLLREHPSLGQVVGVEAHQGRYDRAVEKWQRDGESTQIDFKHADGRQLPFFAGSFDRAVCAEPLEYIDPPLAGLAEIHRVLKPGGTALIIHTDYETQFFNARDKRRSRAVVTAFAEAGPKGYIGRQLLGLCRRAGFQNGELFVYPLVNTEWRPDLYGYRVAHMMADWLRSQPQVPGDDLDAWLTDLEAQAADGEYCYSVSRFICSCHK